MTRGPGSFTGLRIGLAAARGIGLASDRPVLGVDRFEIYREAYGHSGKNLLVVLEFKRSELFCRFFPYSGVAHEASMMMHEQIKNFLDQHPNTDIVGDANFIDASYAIVNEAIGSAAWAAQAVASNPEHLPRPLYLRAPDITVAARSEKIQNVTRDHAALLAELHAESFPQAPWNVDVMRGSLSLDTTQGWICIENDRPTGFILCQIAQDQSEILTFCVRSLHRRRGLGERLVRHAMNEARLRGAKKLFLEVAADNMSAIRLYEKMDFRIAGRRPGYYRSTNRNIDAVMYSLDLASRCSST